MRVITLGVHVVDTLARPIESIPEGQGGQLVEEIRLTPAGTAGGTAVTLAKLGAEVRSAGAIGSDALGEVLVSMLGRAGVDTGLLVRRDGVQTSASVLPIRPDGSRPAFHVIGANGHLQLRRTRPGTRSPRPTTCTWARPSSWAARRPPRSCATRAPTRR